VRREGNKEMVSNRGRTVRCIRDSLKEKRSGRGVENVKGTESSLKVPEKVKLKGTSLLQGVSRL